MAKSKKSNVSIISYKQVGKNVIVSFQSENGIETKTRIISDKEERDSFKTKLGEAIANPKNETLQKEVISLLTPEIKSSEEISYVKEVVQRKVKDSKEFAKKTFALDYLSDENPMQKVLLEHDSQLKEFFDSAFAKTYLELVEVDPLSVVCIIKDTNLVIPKELLLKMTRVVSKTALLEFLKKTSSNKDKIAARGMLKFAAMGDHFHILENGFLIGYKKVKSRREKTQEDILVSELSNRGEDLAALKFDYSYGKVEAVPAKTGEFTIIKKLLSEKNKGATFTDSYSSSMNIRLFSPVVISREQCDTDPNRTCSHGLHVGTYDYANWFTGDVLLMVAFSPEDAVAVPQDGGKIRVCRYYPVKQIDNVVNFSQLPESEQSHILSIVQTLDQTYAKEEIEKTNNEFVDLSYAELVEKRKQMILEGEEEILEKITVVLTKLFTVSGVRPSIISFSEEQRKNKEVILNSAVEKTNTKKKSSAKKESKKELSPEEQLLSDLNINKEEMEIIMKKITSVMKMRHRLENYLVIRKTEIVLEENKPQTEVTSIMFAKSDSFVKDYNKEELGTLLSFKEAFETLLVS